MTQNVFAEPVGYNSVDIVGSEWWSGTPWDFYPEKILEPSANPLDAFSRNPWGSDSPITKSLPTQNNTERKIFQSDWIWHRVNLHINNNVLGEFSPSVFKSNSSSVTNLKIKAARFHETLVIYLKTGIFISTAVRMSVSKAASRKDISALRVRRHSSCWCYR